MTKTIAQLRQHITDIAAAFRVDLIDVPDLPYDNARLSFINPTPAIFIPTVSTEFGYAIALHELGHLLALNGTALPRIIGEEAAWEWAAQDIGLHSHGRAA